MTVKIYTFAHKRPDFLEMQAQSFKNYLKDYEFIIFNNASFDQDKSNFNEIHNWCSNNQIQCIDIAKDKDLINLIEKNKTSKIFNKNHQYLDASVACSYPLCWAWKNIISPTNDKICIIDSDMFFIKEENIEQLLDNYDLIFVPQQRGSVYYMWNGIVFANLSKLPDKHTLNWWGGKCQNVIVDVGGQTHNYLKKNKLNILEIFSDHFSENSECGFSPANYEFINIENRASLFHYRCGSNWNGMTSEYHLKKTNWTKQIIGYK